MFLLRLIVITSQYINHINCNGKLKFVTILFRHGDRTPIKTFPTDTYQEQDWPNGFGQLTARGALQLQTLGSYLRLRYADFLDSKFTKQQLFVRSTMYNRTLSSAANLLKTFVSESVPEIHTVQLSEDYLLSSKSYCPRRDQLTINAIRFSDKAKSLRKKYRKIFQFLANKTGIQHVDIKQACEIWDTLLVEKIYDRLPYWANEMNLFRELPYLYWQLLKLKNLNKELRKLRSGVLFSTITDNMMKAAKGLTDLRMVLYSAHDSTQASFLAFMNVLNRFPPPPYASAIIVELFEDSETHYVRFQYLNGTWFGSYNPSTTNMSIPGCNANVCELETLVKLFKHLIPKDIIQECKTSQSNDEEYDY